MHANVRSSGHLLTAVLSRFSALQKTKDAAREEKRKDLAKERKVTSMLWSFSSPLDLPAEGADAASVL